MGKGDIVNKEYALEMFSNIASNAVKIFEKHSQENNTDICLEIEEGKVNISDERLKEIVTQRFGIEAIRIGAVIKERQNAILKELKMVDGASIRQIARVTGLSQMRVWKA
jgi:DNA-directed RNA polymerase specialized sigma subunit